MQLKCVAPCRALTELSHKSYGHFLQNGWNHFGGNAEEGAKNVGENLFDLFAHAVLRHAAPREFRGLPRTGRPYGKRCAGRHGGTVREGFMSLRSKGGGRSPPEFPQMPFFTGSIRKTRCKGCLAASERVKKLPRMSLRCRSRWRRRSLTDAGSPLAGRSEATWQSHAGSFEFAENHLKIKTILRDCHGRKRPRNDLIGLF